MNTQLSLTNIDGIPMVDTRVIACGCGVEHRSAFRLLNEQLSEIEAELGIVRFEIAKLSSGAGRPQKFALLTEDQATALITMFQNTRVVVSFKVRLSKAFGELRRERKPRRIKPPTYDELCRMGLDQDQTIKTARLLFERIAPKNDYASLTKDGVARIGVRRASFVAGKSRNNDAREVVSLKGQLTLKFPEVTVEEAEQIMLQAGLTTFKGRIALTQIRKYGREAFTGGVSQ